MDKWPVFSEKEVIVGNPEANIGICTLWTPREDFAKEYLGEELRNVALVGNLYSKFGLGYLIRNYLASPNLRFLIVTGVSLGNSKEAILNLANDINLLKKMSLEKWHVERFLNQVRILFLEKGSVVKILKKKSYFSYDLERQKFEPIIIPMPEPTAEIFPGPKCGYLIRAKNILEGYIKLLKEIRRFGHMTGEDSEGHKRQELWGLHMAITDQDPLDFSSIPHPEYNAGLIEEYCRTFWEGTEPEDVRYRYGHIIRNKFGDQIEAILKAFEQKQETFRTVISLWDPDVNCGSIVKDDSPCFITLHPRIINNSLEMLAYIRTNDMYSGWSVNAAMLRYFQFKFLEQLKIRLKRPDIQLGELEITSGSAHIYDHSWLSVDDFMGESEEKTEKFYPDPKGNFEVKAGDGVIVVNHYGPDGADLLQVFKGTTARELSRKIEPFISQTSNALYVGRALQKAEEEVKNGVLRNKS